MVIDNSFAFASYAGTILRICLLILVGMPLVRWCSYVLTMFCTKRLSQHVGLLIGNLVFYGGLIFIVVTILHEFGFNVTALLGAAGVFGIAIGFASQTSISNIISGFFLLLERPFFVGDIIKSGDIVGHVEAIDLLSVRIRTFDNKMVRLPNEMVLKHTVNNLTYYPIKRIDCLMSLPYAYELENAQQLVRQVIAHNELFLTDPFPVVTVNKLAQHDYDTEIRTFLMIRVWVATDKFRSAPAMLIQQLKDQFDKNDVKITIIQVNS
jgi:small-conductance mechanosensitive channel